MFNKILKNHFSQIKPNIVDIIKNFEKVSEPQRKYKIIQNSINSVIDNYNGNHISRLGDLTSYSALLQLQQKMLSSQSGRKILAQKPRINAQTLQKYKLSELPDNTFGKAYYRFLNSHQFSPNERPLVKYIPDLQLAYIMQRYKQIHDFIHVLLIKQISVNDELLVKWFEMIQLGLPSTALAAFFTPFMLSYKQNYEFFTKYLMGMIKAANRCEFILSIKYEENFSKDIEEFRNQIRINTSF